MKGFYFFIGSMIASVLCLGQEGEFKTYASGLMYSDTTMNQLELIVDSLNIKFRTCELNKTYYSKYQSKSHFVFLEDGKVSEAKKDMENNISFDDFVKKYPKAESDKGLLVVKYKYKNYQDKDVVVFRSVLDDNHMDFENNTRLYTMPVKGTWVFKHWKKTSYSDESIRGFCFVTEFENQPLPEYYARMVQYSDCMVDTSAQLYREGSPRTGVRYGIKQPPSLEKFMEYVHKETHMPEHDKENHEEYYNLYRIWDSRRVQLLDSISLSDEKFHSLLRMAVKSALIKGGSNDEFEEYVGRYYSKASELELKRRRIVVGGCSMDSSPRVHAVKIAVLSAETVNWEVFLRAHLDIMNDRFERASDGSYAWQRRQTYIKELEELDINVTDLLLGISIRVENPSQNHYYGSIGRVGRALSETKSSVEIEQRMLEMIRDKGLDDYNRALMYYLFLNYNYNLEDKKRQEENRISLRGAVEEMPEYLAAKMLIED